MDLGRKDNPESSDGEGLVRKASTYMDSLALLVPERVIPEHDDRDDVFAVRLGRESKPGEEYTLYMTHLPGCDRAYLNIKQLDAEEGERFRIRSVDRFEEDDFARNYNDDRPKGLENTELSLEGRTAHDEGRPHRAGAEGLGFEGAGGKGGSGREAE